MNTHFNGKHMLALTLLSLSAAMPAMAQTPADSLKQQGLNDSLDLEGVEVVAQKPGQNDHRQDDLQRTTGCRRKNDDAP